MYIIPRVYQPSVKGISGPGGQTRTAFLVIPPETGGWGDKFDEVVETAFEEMNRESGAVPWRLNRLDCKCGTVDANQNYSEIYQADAMILECSDKDPDVFYILGLAHACGCPVCSCYRRTAKVKTVNVPFNVHGRQSLTYSIRTLGEQKELIRKLKNWVRNYD